MDGSTGTVAEQLHADAHALAWAALADVDSDLPALCEASIARLIGLATVAPAPQSPLQRACVDLVEQIVLDVSGVTDQLVTAVASHLGSDATATFVCAALMVEQRLRMRALWEHLGLEAIA